MNNISAIIQSVQRDLSEMQQNRLKDLAKQLPQQKKAIHELTQQKNEWIDQKLKAKKSEKKLKLQKRIYQLESWLKSLQNQLQKNAKSARDISSDKHKTNKRLLSILDEMDATTTDAIASPAEGGSDATLPSLGSQALAHASEAALIATHLQKSTHSEIENLKNQEQKNALDKSASMVGRQLSAIKKSKFIKFVFKVLRPCLQAAAAALTGGTSLVLQGAINALTALLESRLLYDQSQSMQRSAKAENHLQKLSAQTEDTIQNERQQNQASEVAAEKTLEKIEYAKSLV